MFVCAHLNTYTHEIGGENKVYHTLFPTASLSHTHSLLSYLQHKRFEALSFLLCVDSLSFSIIVREEADTGGADVAVVCSHCEMKSQCRELDEEDLQVDDALLRLLHCARFHKR